MLVGVRCGLHAGLGVAALAAVTYLPHIFIHWGGDPANLNRWFEMIMWLVVGLLTGMLSDRERAASREAEAARDHAEASAREAREAARLLLGAQEQLQRADRLATLGLLSASLAHEVRNPLGSLKGIADMLRKDFPEGHPRRELVDILDAEVERLNGVVEAHLDSARPGHASGDARVREVADAVVRLVAHESARRNVRAETSVEPEGMTVPLSRDLLQQVLINLVLNSLHALEGRGGGMVRIAARRQNGRASVAVEDDGPGFPQEVTSKEPHPFFTTRPFGTGLGLPIVRRIVESHRGRLVLDNRSEGGARACIEFGGTS